MHFEKTHHLSFNYQKQLYCLTIDQLNFSGGNMLFKVNVHHQRYWLINRGGDWQFMAQVPVDSGVRDLLIEKISGLSAGTLGLQNSSHYLPA